MILTNCVVVTRADTFHGTVSIEDGRIADAQPGRTSVASAIDLDGHLLIPGLVELHTDNLEKHICPRSARWPGVLAVRAHDAQIRAAAITTVLDAVCIGVDRDFTGQSRDFMDDSIAALDAARAAGGLGAEHYLHARCELPHPELLAGFERIAQRPDLRMVSLMDHTPGQRQTVDLEALLAEYRRRGPATDDWFSAMVAGERERQAKYAAPNRCEMVARTKLSTAAVLASHDDATEAHIAEAVADGVAISEFPTTGEAAAAAKRLGMATIMGSPNIVLGGSQSGNLSASEAVRQGWVDALSSDYVPISLLDGALRMFGHLSLPEAVAMVTATPAALAGFDDRGRIEPGLRADLAEVSWRDGVSRVHTVWSGGVRVA